MLPNTPPQPAGKRWVRSPSRNASIAWRMCCACSASAVAIEPLPRLWACLPRRTVFVVSEEAAVLISQESPLPLQVDWCSSCVTRVRRASSTSARYFCFKLSKRRTVFAVIGDNCPVFTVVGWRTGRRGIGELRDQSAARAREESWVDSALTPNKVALVESKVGVAHAAPHSLETHDIGATLDSFFRVIEFSVRQTLTNLATAQ